MLLALNPHQENAPVTLFPLHYTVTCYDKMQTFTT